MLYNIARNYLQRMCAPHWRYSLLGSLLELPPYPIEGIWSEGMSYCLAWQSTVAIRSHSSEEESFWMMVKPCKEKYSPRWGNSHESVAEGAPFCACRRVQRGHTMHGKRIHALSILGLY